MRWWRNTLAEVRILHFAIRYEPRIDLRQGLASPAPLRRSSQNRNHTIYKKAIAGFGIPPHKSCLLARCCDFGTGSLERRSALLSSLLTAGRENDSARL